MCALVSRQGRDERTAPATATAQYRPADSCGMTAGSQPTPACRSIRRRSPRQSSASPIGMPAIRPSRTLCLICRSLPHISVPACPAGFHPDRDILPGWAGRWGEPARCLGGPLVPGQAGPIGAGWSRGTAYPPERTWVWLARDQQMIGMDNTAASSQFQITSGTAQAFAIPASQTVAVAAQIVAARLRRRSTSAPSPCSASPSCRMASRCRASEPAPGQASSKLQPGPRPPQPAWPWRRDRVAGRARRHVSSRPPVGDRCVPPREQDQRGLGRPGRPDLHGHRGLRHQPGRLSYRPPSAVQAHEAEQGPTAAQGGN